MMRMHTNNARIRAKNDVTHRRINLALERGLVLSHLCVSICTFVLASASVFVLLYLYEACTIEAVQRLWRWCVSQAQNLANLVRVEATVAVGDIPIWAPKLNAILAWKCD
jgi:hypothetical protein